MRLCDELAKYPGRDVYPFHMPGHKRNPLFFGASRSENGGCLPPEQVDITEIYSFDDLRDPHGVIKEEQERAAKIFGSGESFILVCGSTCGNLTGISAAVPVGGRVLAIGDFHQSVYNALRLRQAKVTRIRRIGSDWEPASVFDAPECAEPAGNLALTEEVDLVIITTPTYEGNVCNIAALADACHSRGIPLLVDAAHGAHLKFCHEAAVERTGDGIYFPQDAVSAGADIVVNSLHKTLPSMTGTSLLHVNTRNGLVDINKIKYYLQTFQTTSPSYVLMGSISYCLKFLEEGEKDENGEKRPAREWFADYVNKIARFYREAGTLEKMKILSPEGRDPGKLVIMPPEGMTGFELMDILRRDYSLELERATRDYALAMTSVCDMDEGFERLLQALQIIDKT